MCIRDSLYEKPFGMSIAGTAETVSSLSREKVVELFNSIYSTNHMIFSVVGKVEWEDVLEEAKKFPANTKKIEPLPIVKKFAELMEKRKGIDQAHEVLGFHMPRLIDKNRYAAEIFDSILGGGMSSRLFQEIREKRGLAYYISTHSEVNPDTGYLVSYAGVDHKKINEVVSLILEEYKKIKEKDLSKKEVERAKEYLKGRLRLSLEESENVASFYGSQELLENRILTPEEKIKEIEKVTPGDIKEVGKEIFMKNKLNLAVISPYHRTFKHFSI